MLAGWYRYWGERIYVSVFSTNCEDTGTWTATYRLSCRSITIETNNIFQKCFISSSNIVHVLRFLISPTFLSASDEQSLVWCPECRPLCVTLLQTTRLENNIWYRQHPQMRWCQEIRNPIEEQCPSRRKRGSVIIPYWQSLMSSNNKSNAISLEIQFDVK